MSEVLAPERSVFSVGQYLDARDASEEFVVVELGHRGEPIAAVEPGFFSGGRLYVGVEANLRDVWGKVEEDNIRFRAANPDKNIVFIDHELGGMAIREGEGNSACYEGSYNAETVLHAGIANEVFLSNVFGDPHVAFDKQRTAALLAEVSRLAAKGGFVVIRETITPQYVKDLQEETLAEQGLTSFGIVDFLNMRKCWKRLEKVYTRPGLEFMVNQKSFYQFLGKTAVRS